jgi:23S rRNA pseudouridine2605 synthase
MLSGMRLNAYLARAGVCSRRNADELIAAGRVRVNGEVAGLATVVGDDDAVELDGKPLEPERLITVLLYKPAGVVATAKDTHGRPTVVELVKAVGVRLVPVGRLDADTTGVLLLTNDGQLAQRLAHPSYEVDKVYEAFLRGIPSDDDLLRLALGVELEDGKTAPAQVRRLARSVVELTIHEGRNRQVKRMCEAVGHRVIRLHRSRYAGLDLAGLEPGQFRRLSRAEVERLREGARPAAGPSAKGTVVSDRARPTAPRAAKGGDAAKGADGAKGAAKGAGAPTSPAPRPTRAPRSGPSPSGTSARRGRPSR